MCSSVHPLCFHHSGQKHAAVESSSICAQALGRGWGATRWVNPSFSSSCIQSMHFPAFLPLQLSYPACSSPPESSPLLEKPKPCAPESCIRSCHRVGWTMEQLCSSCTAVSLLSVWWSGLILSWQHLTGTLPIQACLVPPRPGAF